MQIELYKDFIINDNNFIIFTEEKLIDFKISDSKFVVSKPD